MGAKIGFDNPRHWIPHPSTILYVIYIFLHACHMLKLARNVFGDFDEIFINGFLHPAKWSHIVQLHEDQVAIGLRAANKLSLNHIDLHKHEMKVSYATQLFSRSVAAGVDDGRIEGRPGFENIEPTVFLCRTIDRLFDFCNSRSPLASGQREGLIPQNYEEKKEDMMKISSFLQVMSIYEKRFKLNEKEEKCYYSVKVLVKNSRRKTCVLGFHTTLLSIFAFAKDLFETFDEPVEKLLTYFLLQHYIEHLFGLMRLQRGNDNPTPEQCMYIIRKLIVLKCGGLKGWARYF